MMKVANRSSKCRIAYWFYSKQMICPSMGPRALCRSHISPYECDSQCTHGVYGQLLILNYRTLSDSAEQTCCVHAHLHITYKTFSLFRLSPGPISNDDTCATATCSESIKFGYSVGSTYRFTYEADTVTSLQGASEEHSSLHVRAAADIHVLSPCEHVLTVSRFIEVLFTRNGLGVP